MLDEIEALVQEKAPGWKRRRTPAFGSSRAGRSIRIIEREFSGNGKSVFSSSVYRDVGVLPS